MKLPIVGVVKHVSPVQDKESYRFQLIHFSIIEFDRETGEAKNEEVYEATIFNKNIESLSAEEYVGKRVQATCWTKSLPRESASGTFYNIVLNCSAIKEV